MIHEEKAYELREAMHNAKNRHHFERFQAVYLILQRYTRKEIVEITGRTIKNYL